MILQRGEGHEDMIVKRTHGLVYVPESMQNYVIKTLKSRPDGNLMGLVDAEPGKNVICLWTWDKLIKL